MRASSRRRCGFSLVEVATSLGVISFALVALIGMIPLGLENGRYAASETRATQLLKMISATLETEPFTASPCFLVNATASSKVDFSKLGSTTGALSTAPDLTLYASYDVRNLPRLERVSGGTPPGEAIYRVELRGRRVLSPADPTAVLGTNLNVRLLPLRGKDLIGEAWVYVPNFQRSSLTVVTTTTPGGSSNSSGGRP